MLPFFVLYILSWVAQPAQGVPQAKPIVRSCPDSWDDAPRGKKTPSNKKRNASAKSVACIELAVSPLDIQEYLQSYARQENWGITDDQLTQDSWTFSLKLTKEELFRDTAAESSPKGVEWTSGSARVHINTLELTDGYARTTVRAIFRGYGRATDQFAMKKEYWELDSRNAFESGVVSELRSHFASPQLSFSAGSRFPVCLLPGHSVRRCN
jgi:hypothetical protein